MAQIQKQDWHHKGSDCCSPIGTCLLSWCLPCITYGRIRHRVRSNGSMDGYSCCNSSCAAHCGLSLLGINFVLPLISRGDMRAKYHLQGSAFKDCLCACCCQPCDLTQQDKEAEWREMNKPGSQEQYKAENPMVYPGQP